MNGKKTMRPNKSEHNEKEEIPSAFSSFAFSLENEMIKDNILAQLVAPHTLFTSIDWRLWCDSTIDFFFVSRYRAPIVDTMKMATISDI